MATMPLLHVVLALQAHARPAVPQIAVRPGGDDIAKCSSLNGSMWSPRWGMGAVALSDAGHSLVMLAGGTDTSNAHNNLGLCGDIWATDDKGLTWKQQSQTDFGDVLQHGDASIKPKRVVRGLKNFCMLNRFEKLFVLGGVECVASSSLASDCAETPQRRVYVSEDHGLSWSSLEHSVPWDARGDFGAVVLSDGTLVIAGGQRGYIHAEGDGSYFLHDVWSSYAGDSWIEETFGVEVAWTRRAGFGLVATGHDDLLLFGGFDGSYHNDVYHSTKGNYAIWTKVKTSKTWSERAWFSFASTNDIVVLIGGKSDRGVLGGCFVSKDLGKSWSPNEAVSDRVGAVQRASMVALHDGSVLLLGGDRGGSPSGASEAIQCDSLGSCTCASFKCGDGYVLQSRKLCDTTTSNICSSDECCAVITTTTVITPAPQHREDHALQRRIPSAAPLPPKPIAVTTPLPSTQGSSIGVGRNMVLATTCLGFIFLFGWQCRRRGSPLEPSDLETPFFTETKPNYKHVARMATKLFVDAALQSKADVAECRRSDSIQACHY